MRTHRRLASVTSDGDFAYVQFGCGHVTCKREGLVAGPDCQLAASGGRDIVTVAVSSRKMRNTKSDCPRGAFRGGRLLDHRDEERRIAARIAKLPELLP